MFKVGDRVKVKPERIKMIEKAMANGVPISKEDLEHYKGILTILSDYTLFPSHYKFEFPLNHPTSPGKSFIFPENELELFSEKVISQECNCSVRDLWTFGHRISCGRKAPIDR